MGIFFTSTSGFTRVQSSFSSSSSNCFIWLRGVPTKYWPPRLPMAARFSSLTMPRSNTQIRRSLAIFTLHHAQNGFHRGNVGAVAVKRLVAEGKTFAVDDQRNHHLLAVGTMIARVAARHHRVLVRRALYIRARQVIEQHIELRPE